MRKSWVEDLHTDDKYWFQFGDGTSTLAICMDTVGHQGSPGFAVRHVLIPGMRFYLGGLEHCPTRTQSFARRYFSGVSSRWNTTLGRPSQWRGV